MVNSQLNTCPACRVSLKPPVEEVNAEGKKTKVGTGQEPTIKVVTEDDGDPDSPAGSDVIGFTFTCARCTYLWFEEK